MTFRLVLIGLLLSVCLCACSASNSAKLVGQQAPAPRLTMLEDGSLVPMTETRGRTTVILFWATWCHSSRPVVEDLDELAEEYADRSDVEFIAVNIDSLEKEDKVRERIHYKKLDNLKHAFSGNEHYDEAFMAFQVEDIPQLFVISPGGTILAEGSSVGFVEDILEEG